MDQVETLKLLFSLYKHVKTCLYMLKHQCLLHRFESEILARPTCEELEQRTAHATARELGRRCNPTNGADEIPSDSISHQKM